MTAKPASYWGQQQKEGEIEQGGEEKGKQRSGMRKKKQHTRRELAVRAKLRILGAGEDTAGAEDVWFCRAGWRGRYRDPGDEDRRGSGWLSGRGEML